MTSTTGNNTVTRPSKNKTPCTTNTFRIIHPKLLNDFCDCVKLTWTFTLGFLRTYNGLDSSVYYPIYCPLCSPHSQPAFLRIAFSLTDNDTRRKRIVNDDPMIHSSERLEQGNMKNTYLSYNFTIISNL